MTTATRAPGPTRAGRRSPARHVLSANEKLLATAGSVCSIVGLAAMFFTTDFVTRPEADTQRRFETCLEELDAIEASWASGWSAVETTADRAVRLLESSDPSAARALDAVLRSEPDSARLFRATRAALEAARKKKSPADES